MMYLRRHMPVLVFLFLLGYLIREPASAATQVKSAAGGIGMAMDSLTTFLGAL